MLETLKGKTPDATWKHEGHRIELFYLGYSHKQRKERVGYRIFDRNKLVIEEDALFCSPLHSPICLETISDIIAFSTWDNQYTRDELIKKGAKDYDVPAHWLTWITSYRAECLSLIGSDIEDARGGDAIHAVHIDCACGMKTLVYDDWAGRQVCMWCGKGARFPKKAATLVSIPGL